MDPTGTPKIPASDSCRRWEFARELLKRFDNMREDLDDLTVTKQSEIRDRAE
jgi:hypothetical protein